MTGFGGSLQINSSAQWCSAVWAGGFSLVPTPAPVATPTGMLCLGRPQECNCGINGSALRISSSSLFSKSVISKSYFHSPLLECHAVSLREYLPTFRKIVVMKVTMIVRDSRSRSTGGTAVRNSFPVPVIFFLISSA